LFVIIYSEKFNVKDQSVYLCKLSLEVGTHQADGRVTKSFYKMLWTCHASIIIIHDKGHLNRSLIQ